MFKGIGNLASLMKQAQQMGSKMQEINDQLKTERVTGSAGAGLVTVEVNGLSEVLAVAIDPSLIEKGEQEMIQDLLPAAINDAQYKAKQLHAEAMREMTGGMNLPGLDEAMSQLGGEAPETD